MVEARFLLQTRGRRMCVCVRVFLCMHIYRLSSVGPHRQIIPYIGYRWALLNLAGSPNSKVEAARCECSSQIECVKPRLVLGIHLGFMAYGVYSNISACTHA